MPRLLRRLVQQVKISKNEHAALPPRKIEPAPSHPRLAVPDELSAACYSPMNRKQSIILDEVNPITNRNVFTQHKNRSPTVPSVSGLRKPRNANRSIREMTDLECKLWSNPYLRMLGSPLRRCLVTQQYLPVDFMIRLAVLQIKRPRISRPMVVLLPDGVEHPRFRRRNSGRGYYLTAHKQLIQEMLSRSSYRRIPVSNLQLHSLLAEQIAHQLRLRVIQEIVLMTESLRCAPQGALKNTVIRRLTRTEWTEIKASGQIPQPGAVAVLVVPPLNKRKCSKSFSSFPPLSVLHGTQAIEEASLGQLLPAPQVPLYNGITLFPPRPIRSELYEALQKALVVESRARWREVAASRNSLGNEKQTSKSRSKQSMKEKASHAYLLCSDVNTVKRADSVPLAIALWRIRMWEAQGWGDVPGKKNSLDGVVIT